MNNSKKEDNVSLLNRKNKAVNDCKEKYEKMIGQVSKINQQNESVRQQIESECERINQTLMKLKQRSNQYMTVCMDALTQEKKSSQITCTSEVAAYLKTEKQLLKAISESKQSGKTKRINLHDMLAKVQLQRVLRKLKRQQLQEQIRYLESNLLVKGNFIYNPSSSLLVSPTEEKQNLARMHNLVDQLQRVIKLSIPCAVQSDSNNKFAFLKAQQSRLHHCDEIIEQEHNKMLNFTKFIDELRNLPEKFSYGQPYFDSEGNELSSQNEYEELKLNEQELDDILQIQNITPIVINLDHPFSIIQSNISQLRTKVKKLEKYSQ